MQVYRIQREKYGGELSGEGARKFGGRWNPMGVPLIYASSSISLAILELMVNLSSYSFLAENVFNIITIEIPYLSPLDEWPIEILPPDWDNLPYSYETQEMGKTLVKDNMFLAVTVPSSIIKQEENILINCLHKDFEKVKVISTIPFECGKRFNK